MLQNALIIIPIIFSHQFLQFPQHQMKKINENGKLPLFRTTIEKRISANQNLLSASKPQFGQQITNEEQLMSSTQTDIAKKIQSKLRVRRATGSQKRLSRQDQLRLNTVEKSQIENYEQNFKEKIQEVWSENEKIQSILLSFSSKVQQGQIKKRIMSEANLLQCQLSSGNFEDILIAKVKRTCQLFSSERKCGQHQSLLGRLLQQRMKKLTDVLKSR